MNTVFVVAGNAPGWVRNQTRIMAEHLTEDGRVLIAMSDGTDDLEHMPGSTGTSTLLGVASTGYPLWTGRMLAVLGVRRRRDRAVLVRFADDRHIVVCLSALVSRLRRETVFVYDSSHADPPRSALRRLTGRVVHRVAAHSTQQPPSSGGPSIALALCGSDTGLANLMIGAANAMSQPAADLWRIVIQCDDPSIEAAIQQSARTGLVVYEPPGNAADLIASTDVVLVRDGEATNDIRRAVAAGTALVLVGHPIGGRITPRFDGAWLVRDDVSSVIVALEMSRRARFGGPSAPEVRSTSRQLIEDLRAESSASKV